MTTYAGHAVDPSTSGPSLRVALCRRTGQLSRVAAADVAAQLREAGCMAVLLDAFRPPHEDLVLGLAAPAGYDVVVSVGDCLATAHPLADALDVALVHIPIPVPRDVGGLVEQAFTDHTARAEPTAHRHVKGAVSRVHPGIGR